MKRFAILRDAIRTSLWAIPAACVVVAGAGAVLLLQIDERWLQGHEAWYLFGGSPEGARSLLEVTSSSMLTFMALVFTITIVALQLASSQLSPRVQRTFLRDRLSKATLGMFIGTFTYSVLVLRSVRADDGEQDAFVPSLSVIVAIVLVLVSVAFFVAYLHHTAHSIRVEAVIPRVGRETTDAIERLFGDGLAAEPACRGLPAEPQGPPSTTVLAEEAGVVTAVDPDALLEVACGCDALIVVRPRVGEFVPWSAPLAEVWHSTDHEISEEVRRAITVASERSMTQDVAYGLRQLVDVGLRALSTGMNDPTTAVEVLDTLHDALRRMVSLEIPDGVHLDDDGALRVLVPSRTWDDLLGLALDELRVAGASSLSVRRRIRSLLEDLLHVASGDRRQAVLRQLEALEEAERLEAGR